tara:strand:- start:791 stop:1012 length:222 start_codon:yes stop_codon:yes gene_type:complete
MTQSGQIKKSTQPKAVEEVKADKVLATPPKKSQYDLLVEELKVKKPEVYEQYRKALKAKKPAWVYPDLTVRIG